MMTLNDVHNALANDLAYLYSLENKDLLNMQMVLRAYGYDLRIAEDLLIEFA